MGGITFNNSNSGKIRFNLDAATSELSNSFQRLSSGLRINSAGDDAAGLAVSEKINTSSVIYSRAINNINDSISLLNTADGALSSLSDITSRLSELANQASNGVLTLSQRKALDSEAYALTQEFNRILSITKFNDKSLLDGTFGNLVTEVGGSQISSVLDQNVKYNIGTGTFQSPATYAGVNATLQVNLADFDKDGDLDMAYLVSAGNSAQVRLNNGDGLFAGASSYSVAGVSLPQGLVVGDVNNDGYADLIGAGSGQDKVGVLINNGNGTFKASVTYATGDNPTAINLADFNGDGFLDVVTGSITDDRVNVLLNNGNGTFGANTQFSAGTDPKGVSTGDFNGDGRIDIVSVAEADDKAYILLGNGNGTFQTAVSYAAGDAVRGVTVVDVNHDGVKDIVTVAAGTDNNVNVLIGNADGTFQSKVTYALSGGAAGKGITYGDLNGDGVQDLFVTAGTTVQSLLGNMDGTFQSATSLGTPAGTDNLAAGDVNGDGVIDLAVAETGGLNPNNILIYTANSTTTTTIGRLNLTTQADARNALSTITTIQDRVLKARGDVGAGLSRLGSTVSVVQNIRTNYEAAYGHIVNADIAAETARMLRLQIIQQAATATLAQSNLQSEVVLSLLK